MVCENAPGVQASLTLEDGTILLGQPFGAATDAVFELVFNCCQAAYALSDLGFETIVLGGRALAVVTDVSQLQGVVEQAFDAAPGRPLLIDQPMEDAYETDGLLIRQAATAMDVPLLTTLSAAVAAVADIRALREKDFRYRSLQAHFGRS